MNNAKIKEIEKEIEQIKEQLQEIGEMRPGSLTSNVEYFYMYNKEGKE